MIAKETILIIGLVLAVWDITFKKLPNVIVIPAIVYGIYLTGNWHFSLFLFFIGAFLYSKNRIAGGDVKLLALFGAFMGPYALIACGLSFCFLATYRTVFSFFGSLPYAPFLMAGSFMFFLQ